MLLVWREKRGTGKERKRREEERKRRGEEGRIGKGGREAKERLGDQNEKWAQIRGTHTCVRTDRHTGTHMHAHIYIYTHTGAMHACTHAHTNNTHIVYTHFSLMDPETWSEVSQIKSRT